MKSELVFNSERLLDEAEKKYLVKGGNDFCFEIRKKPGVNNFHLLLEEELSRQTIFQVAKMKVVKEGFVKIARPSAVKVTLESLISVRPSLKKLKGIIEEAERNCSYFSFVDFFHKNYSLCKNEQDSILDCVSILDYLIRNSDKILGLLPRQIPHGRSTKILGSSSLCLRMYCYWKTSESLTWDDFFKDFGLVQGNTEFRFFAPSAHWKGKELKDFHGIVSEEIQADWQFEVTQALIVENYESFLALAKKSKNTLIIWGGGWKAIQLEKIWSYLPKTIYYWGDIDKEGIEIFDLLHSRVDNKPIPILMSMDTLNKFAHLIQHLPRSEDCQTKEKKLKTLDDLYSYVVKNRVRVEQEQIPWNEAFDL
jgi:hypothetical protein